MTAAKKLDYEALKATVKKPTKKAKTKKPVEAPTPVAQPFLKWAGGKRKLLHRILPVVPRSIETYYEPFLGGGAVFFALLANGVSFKRAVLNDKNVDLMETYQIIQSEQVHDLIALLQTYQYSREFYDHLRMIVPKTLASKIVRAARFIYLNKTGYNGLYRVNRKGEFNVPFGKYANPTICDQEGLLRAHKALQGVELTSVDFDVCLAFAGIGDFIYFDPPYLPISETSSFTAYTSGGFPLADHLRLANTFYDLGHRGVQVLLSNSIASAVRRMYDRPSVVIENVEAPRSINSKGDRRGNVGELLISIGVSGYVETFRRASELVTTEDDDE